MKVQSVNFQTNYSKNQNSKNTNPVSFTSKSDVLDMGVMAVSSEIATRVKFKKPTTLQRLKGHRFSKNNIAVERLKEGHSVTSMQSIFVPKMGLIKGDLSAGKDLDMLVGSTLEKSGTANVVGDMESHGANIFGDAYVGGTFFAHEGSEVLGKVSADVSDMSGSLIGRGMLLNKKFILGCNGDLQGDSRSISKVAELKGRMSGHSEVISEKVNLDGVKILPDAVINCKRIVGKLLEELRGKICSEDCPDARALQEKYPKLVKIMPDGWYEQYLKDYLKENNMQMPEWLSK